MLLHLLKPVLIQDAQHLPNDDVRIVYTSSLLFAPATKTGCLDLELHDKAGDFIQTYSPDYLDANFHYGRELQAELTANGIVVAFLDLSKSRLNPNCKQLSTLSRKE